MDLLRGGRADEQFYEDDLHDECTVLAFRMCVKDLLILFQAGNEGVCNILGTYPPFRAILVLVADKPSNDLIERISGRRRTSCASTVRFLLSSTDT